MKNKIGDQMINNISFDNYRNEVIEEFHTEKILFKRKLTQGAFWTAIDKDLADQYFRDERWIFGIKIKDELKLIDHGIDPNAPMGSGIGFNNRK